MVYISVRTSGSATGQKLVQERVANMCGGMLHIVQDKDKWKTS